MEKFAGDVSDETVYGITSAVYKINSAVYDITSANKKYQNLNKFILKTMTNPLNQNSYGKKEKSKAMDSPMA